MKLGLVICANCPVASAAVHYFSSLGFSTQKIAVFGERDDDLADDQTIYLRFNPWHARMEFYDRQEAVGYDAFLYHAGESPPAISMKALSAHLHVRMYAASVLHAYLQRCGCSRIAVIISVPDQKLPDTPNPYTLFLPVHATMSAADIQQAFLSAEAEFLPRWLLR